LSESVDIDDLLKRIIEEEEFVRSQSANYEEYLPEFIVKAQEDIENIEDCAIKLEKNIEDNDIINKMFRSFHNIKGSAGFVGQDTIQKVAHQSETVLDGCRKGTNKVTKHIIDLFLKSSDYISKICQNSDLNNDEAFLDEIFQHLKELEEEDNNNLDAIIDGTLKPTECNVVDEFFNEFAAETNEHLDEIENNILTLEKDLSNEELVHVIFRYLHTIKGLAGFAGQTLIQRLSHETETILDLCRKENCPVTKDILNITLGTVDIIRKICTDCTLLSNAEFIEIVYGQLKNIENEVLVAENQNIQETEVDDEFLQDFITEAKDHLEAIEMNILNLEKEPENEEIIHSLFRSFHTIKGLAGFVEQVLIGKIAHQTESLLDKCRKKTTKVSTKVVDIILNSTDFIKKICENNAISKDRDFLVEVNTHMQGIQDAEVAPQEASDVIPLQIPKIGEILVEENKLKPEEVKVIIEKQKTEYPDLKFGQIAVKEKKVETKDILNAVRVQQNKVLSSEEYMRIATSKVDNLVDMVGELVITQSLVEQQAISSFGTDNIFYTNFNRMARITKDLQNLAMYLRLIPLKSTFQKISRIARDTINELNKEIEFSTSGDDTEIDRIVTEKLLDPLVHLVKNAIWHGIETKGVVKVSAYNKRGNIFIEVSDDGNGINTERVYQKALEKGLIDPNTEYADKEIQEFIMLPGFSTVEVANNIAGRGVGMDVVRTEIQKIGGKIDIISEKGKGSTFVLKIPVNHAIMNGTIVDINGSNYIIPTINVKQILQPKEEQWIYIHSRKAGIKVRDDIIPLISIDSLFGVPEKSSNLVIILEQEQKYRALPVINVLDRREIVVKPLGKEFSGLNFLSGMSILGDGKVSLILDVDSMFIKEGAK